MIESPKTRFQLNAADVEFVAKLTKNDAFLRAVDAALAQVVWEAGIQNDSVIAQASFHRITGAREFVSSFINLATVPQPLPKPLNPSNLNWNA